MVVFVDLDDAVPGSALEKPFQLKVDPISASAELPPSPAWSEEADAQSVNRNGFSAALSCYPIIKEITRAIDLTTLQALSSVCRQFHVNLAPYRHQLVRETLRCENEYIETLAELLHEGAVIPDSVKSVIQLLSRGNGDPSRMTRGKVGKCARDMVGECRRCAKVVCRNCTVKPPNKHALKGRIRRLCRPCGTVPLSAHLARNSDPHSGPWDEDSVAALAFARTPCNCEEDVWLCTQCGQTLRSNDTTYRRVWAWRTRYSTYLGGVGTGIGEGCQGVKCGRGEGCLASQEIELEVDCEADEGSSSDSSRSGSPAGHAPYYHENGSPIDGHDEDQPGYFRQEVIGIGGVVKHKSKKRVNVGACVAEYEDERETGNYLVREEEGLHRAWCGWCSRVIPAKSEIL
ncbi:unnamed protein product [Penicillium salamii]|nr:unnamed protein product [Penicillium salamii]